jgi:eukaryotic-like serine/threonine-protein kinase
VPPFQGDSPVAVAYQHVRENAAAPSSRVPELPRALDSIVMKALAKNQLNRYQTAGEMRSDLQRALANQPVSAEAVMTDAERTQFIARTPVLPVVPRRDVPPEPEPSSRSGLVWAAIVVVLLIVIGGGIFLISTIGNGGDGGASTSPPVLQAAVPQVIGDSPETAAAKFRTAKLRLVLDTVTKTTNGPCDDGSTPTKDGGVCKLLSSAGENGQPVAVGARLDRGSTVFYQTYVQAKVNVPPVEGLSTSQALQALNAKGLKGTLKRVRSTTQQGQVLNQQPGVGVAVAPGSTVVLTVSTGKVKLPDVTNKTLDDAKAELNRAGFTNVQPDQTQITSDEQKDGLVAAQDPTAGIAYSPDTKVSLTIYQYKKPEPSCTTETPTPTTSTTTSPVGSPTPTASVTITTTTTPSPTSSLPICGPGNS